MDIPHSSTEIHFLQTSSVPLGLNQVSIFLHFSIFCFSQIYTKSQFIYHIYLVDSVEHHPEFGRRLQIDLIISGQLFNKMLECSVFIENNENPSLSFKRFVLGNVYIGLLDRDRDVRHNIHHHIHLCVVTLKNTLKYKVIIIYVSMMPEIYLLSAKIEIAEKMGKTILTVAHSSEITNNIS